MLGLSPLHAPAGYAGGYYDAATGLVNNIERWYDPKATVWISADPTGFRAGDVDLTRYVDNSTTTLTDPGGLAHRKGKSEAKRGDHEIGEARAQREQQAARAREAATETKTCGKAEAKNLTRRLKDLGVRETSLNNRLLRTKKAPDPEVMDELKRVKDEINALKKLRKARGGFVCIRPAPAASASATGLVGPVLRRAAGFSEVALGPIVVGGVAAYDAYNSEYDDEHYELLLGPHADRFCESVIDSLAVGNVPMPPEPREPEPALDSSAIEGEDEPLDPEYQDYVQRLTALQNDNTPLAPPDPPDPTRGSDEN